MSSVTMGSNVSMIAVHALDAFAVGEFLSNLAPFYLLYRVTKLKLTLLPYSNLQSTPEIIAAGYVPGQALTVGPSGGTALQDVSELARSVVSSPPQQTVPVSLTLTRADLLGETPAKWFNVKGTTVDLNQGQIYFASTNSTGVIAYTIELTMEYCSPVPSSSFHIERKNPFRLPSIVGTPDIELQESKQDSEPEIVDCRDLEPTPTPRSSHKEKLLRGAVVTASVPFWAVKRPPP
jgi:hypothetical protein